MANKSEYLSQTNCISFDECPLCFKCRGFAEARIKCQSCQIPKCTRDTHNPKNINMMICRPIVKSDDKISFLNGEPSQE